MSRLRLSSEQGNFGKPRQCSPSLSVLTNPGEQMRLMIDEIVKMFYLHY